MAMEMAKALAIEFDFRKGQISDHFTFTNTAQACYTRGAAATVCSKLDRDKACRYFIGMVAVEAKPAKKVWTDEEIMSLPNNGYS